MFGYNEICDMSLAAIEKLNNAGIKCTVLTKGILPASLAQFSPGNEYGITLISISEAYREHAEPGAAPYLDRLCALKYLHENGCKTWVSIEPYPTPNLIEQSLLHILESIKFADKIIFGRTNYSKNISSYKRHRAFYNEQAALVVSFCEHHNIQYHIKDGTVTRAGI